MKLRQKIKFVYVLSLLTFCAGTLADTLKILNWEDYLSSRVIELWERETGVAIEQVIFDNDQVRDRMLSAASGHRIDLVVIDETASKMFGDAGQLLAPAHYSSVVDMDVFSPFWRNRCGDYAVPYLWGTLGIAYRADKVSAPSSWVQLLKPDDSLRGHIGMMSDYMDTLAPALFYLGYSLNSSDRDQLKQAFELLKHQAPAVLSYQYPISFLQVSEQAEDLYMAMVYSGDQYVMNDIAASDNWRYVVPEEGTVLWVDCLAVMTSSPQQELASKFVAFLMRPDVAAMNAEDLYIATPNQGAWPHLSDEFRSDPEVYISDDLRQRSQLYQVLDIETVKLRQRIANALKMQHEPQ